MISSHQWTSDSLWSRAGLLGELSVNGYSVETDPIQGDAVYDVQGVVRVEISCSFSPGDSLRLFVPVPSDLPWQVLTGDPEVSLTGLQEYSIFSSGWLLLEGISQGEISSVFSVPVRASCGVFNGSEVPGVEDAMVCFPGEDTFMDSCLDQNVFWSGGDRVYLESVSLARGEPNPMRLLERARNRIAGVCSGSDPVDQSILIVPGAELALQGKMDNSVGGVLLAAAILRRWQIPAVAAPGRFNGGVSAGYVLFVHVKPFGWMTLSPVPGDFIAFGTSEPPPVRSWPWGVPGLTVYAESQNSSSFWRSLSRDSLGLTYTVDFLPL